MSQSRFQRIQTGIPGLDVILQGGVFRGNIYIIQGAPGAGKTILANQLCFSHAAGGGKALYVTLLAESHARLLGQMEGMSFFQPNLIPDRVTYLSAFRILEDEGLKAVLDTLRREITGHKATLLVLDGLVSAEETATSPRELKKFIHELQTQAGLTNCTTFLLTSAYMGQQLVSAEHTMVDGIFELRTQLYGRRAERDIQVHKSRGSHAIPGVHSFRISDAGLSVYPRIEAVLASPSGPDVADEGLLSTGVEVIDEMLGGGVRIGSNTLMIGSAGVGKTTLGLHFLGAPGAGKGLYFSFNESPAAIAAKARMLNLPASKLLDSGEVRTCWQPVTEALLDEVCTRLLAMVRERGIERLFLDGADGFGKITTEQQRIAPVLTALTNELTSLSVTTLSTAEMDLSGTIPGQPFAGLSARDLSPVAENVMVLRYASTRSETHRLVAVVKARNAQVDMRFRRYALTPSGMVVDPDHRRAEEILSNMPQASGMPASSLPSPGAPFGGGE